MGTGAFLDLITGSKCGASLSGMYPLVAWQFKTNSKLETTFCMEGAGIYITYLINKYFNKYI